MQPEPPILPYATPDGHHPQNSRYATASICVGAFGILWSITDTPLDPLKHDKIGAIISVIGIILAFGALRGPNRKRLSGLVGFFLCILSFAMNWFFPAWG
ncbi:MAG: hypothetical protein ABSB33_13070 [Tepidisphaeraceae bacterium]|jgi:hypothetical protein